MVGGKDAEAGNAGTRVAQPVALINSRVQWTQPINVADFELFDANTTLVPKITIPGPCALHFRGGDAAVLASAYKDLDQFWDDTIEAFGRELQALADAGCRYVQIDETAFAKFGDPEVQTWLKARGDDWSTLIDKYIAVTNRLLEGGAGGHRRSACISAAAIAAASGMRKAATTRRRAAVQRARYPLLLPRIRLAARRHLHAAAAGADRTRRSCSASSRPRRAAMESKDASEAARRGRDAATSISTALR